jgi:glutamate-5-semialdehyde dehydrogenase
VIGRASTAQKNRALQAAANALDAARAELTAANEQDLAAGRANGLEPALLERLALTPARIDGMIVGLRQVAALPDPVGAIRDMSFRPSGIQVGKMRVPLGVIGIIYESRPNVTIDAASLCLKSGNATILRGGSEAIHSNRAIAACIQRGLAEADLPAAVVQVVETTDRAAVGALITMPEYVDVIVPRGGRGLIERVSRDARVPVIKHLDGICHVYVSAHADLRKPSASRSTPRPIATASAAPWKPCWSTKLLPRISCRRWPRSSAKKALSCVAASAPGRSSMPCRPAKTTGAPSIWTPILSIRVVDGLDQAIEHINHYGSHHTDSIVSENQADTRRFVAEVDSSSVMINTPTCFADGFRIRIGCRDRHFY